MARSEDGILLAKGVAMAVLGAATFVMGGVPLILAKIFKWEDADQEAGKQSTSKTVMSILMCFGGGALLCTTFLHLLPEVREGVEKAQQDGQIDEIGLSVAELIMCCGFFVMYAAEQCVDWYVHSKQNKHADHGTHEHFPATVLVGEDDLQAKRDRDMISSLRGLLIVVALSIHELFEGLAVGLENSASTVWYMLGAICAHKLVIAFCVGVQLVNARIRVCVIVLYIVVFSVITPIGVGVGIAVTWQPADSSGLAAVFLQGLATGTLLYLVFFEVLLRERAHNNLGFSQLLALITGFAVMCGLMLAVANTTEAP